MYNGGLVKPFVAEALDMNNMTPQCPITRAIYTSQGLLPGRRGCVRRPCCEGLIRKLWAGRADTVLTVLLVLTFVALLGPVRKRRIFPVRAAGRGAELGHI
ncbi:hypothetical protein FKM82_024029 [Ascaphus truei]